MQHCNDINNLNATENKFSPIYNINKQFQSFETVAAKSFKGEIKEMRTISS